jgi:succinate dehydrogenase/fumarate reductase flavoprotein subunit
MWLKSGIIRSCQSLNEALVDIERLRKSLDETIVRKPKDLLDTIRINNMFTVSEMVVRSALVRNESRGAHFRIDYPEQNDREWISNVVISKKNQAINIRAKKVKP